MKRALTLCLTLILMVCLSACSETASVKTNPLADKVYEPLAIDKSTNFPDFVSSIYLEYSEHIYLTGTLKNLSGNTYNVEDILAQMVFDGTYAYNAKLTACAWTNNFFGENVKPLGTVKYYIYASIPDELIDNYEECEIKFGFANEFSVSRYDLVEDNCNYLFTLTAKR